MKKYNDYSTLKINSLRKGCKDVFNASIVADATYNGVYDFPVIYPTYDLPNRLIAFSRCVSCRDYNQWVHFYEDDFLFERIWRNPSKYLKILKKFNGVILPDFSLYRDMPFVMQLWNIYRSRAIGHWLQVNGIKVIPDIRYGDIRTYDCSCDGISKNGVISIGSHGTIKNKEDRNIFYNGVDVVVKRLQPVAIVVYGSCSDAIFDKYKQQGIQIVHFEPDYYCQLSLDMEVD